MKTLRTLMTLCLHRAALAVCAGALLPLVALAQYTGGQGRGDVLVAFDPPALIINTITVDFEPEGLCADELFFSVPYTAVGTYGPGNTFTLQLSDGNGSFANPVDLGTLVSNVSGSIGGAIPFGTPFDVQYLVRVVASTPATIGTPNSNGIIMLQLVNWYADVDGDGLGDPNDFVLACLPPDPSYVNNDDDACPLAVGFIPNIDIETCACALGYFATITDINGNDVITACTICPPGSFCADGLVAVECPAGRFQDQPGQTTCIDCQEGEFSATTGATSCSACPVGTFNAVSGATSCAPCDAGFFNNSTGQTECSACPPGRFSANSGQVLCDLCPANTYNPSSAQTECLACPSGESSTAGSVACTPDGNTTDVTLELRTTGGTSDQISWTIVDLNDVQVCGAVLGTYGPNDTPITADCSLPDGCYRLRVFDSEGDGFGVGGGYQLRLAGPNPQDIRIIDNFGNFTTGSLSAIGSGPFGGPSAFCVPIAETPKPLFQLRDKLDFVSGQYLVCEEDAAVSAQWPSGAVTTTGYEFWLFDPNGSYSYRRFRNHATSDGFGNVGATRACHMKINGWFASQAAPANVLLNVRIRTRVNGVNGLWGPAYRFKIDPARAACPLTLLNDFPGNQFESCNQTRSWGGGSNLIHARPVSGANRYQWRFRTVGEPAAPIIIRTTNTYFLALNWTVNPLVPGKTYTVDVRASKTAGATWCTDAVAPALVDEWGTICNLTIAGSQAQGGGQNLALDSDNTSLSLYPNPNRGDQVWLSIDRVDEGVETISVDFFDLAGQRAVARTLATQGTNLNSLLELNGLAAGVYIVHITAGEKVYTERLVIAQ